MHHARVSVCLHFVLLILDSLHDKPFIQRHHLGWTDLGWGLGPGLLYRCSDSRFAHLQGIAGLPARLHAVLRLVKCEPGAPHLAVKCQSWYLGACLEAAEDILHMFVPGVHL